MSPHSVPRSTGLRKLARFALAAVRDERGATAAMYALALPVLVGAAGIGFDYSRIAAMDTELQNAADQAALAGATQLDQSDDSLDNAIAAASGGLVSNLTRFANDGQSATIDVPEGNVFFYATREDAESDENRLDPDDEDSPSVANFIRVRVETRTANFALTPVVGALAGEIQFAEAVAGIGAALCRTPPLMMCNPSEPLDNVDPAFDFDFNEYRGKGVLVKGGSSWAPGNFGFLDTFPGPGGGTPELRQAFGWNSPAGNCISQTANSAVETSTGNKVDVSDAINTRFDIYDNTSCPDGGTCSASINSTKDLVHPNSLGGNQACKIGNSGWKEAGKKYLPPSYARWVPAAADVPGSMGHPRDICHSTSSNLCDEGKFGDGFWDRDLYFRVHYRRKNAAGAYDGTYWSNADWQTNTGLTESGGSNPRFPTRFEVYQWEIAHRGETIDGVKILDGPNAASAYGQPVCSAGKGHGSGLVPGDNSPDRRRLSVAVVNCVANEDELNGGSGNVPVRRFMDVFLVQPSAARTRTAKDEIYIEIIGETAAGSAGENAGTVVRRDMPYLIR